MSINRINYGIEWLLLIVAGLILSAFSVGWHEGRRSLPACVYSIDARARWNPGTHMYECPKPLMASGSWNMPTGTPSSTIECAASPFDETEKP